MRALSLKAKNHPWLTRFIIIFLLYPIINICGFALGIIFNQEGFYITAITWYVLIFLTLVLATFYPRNRMRLSYYRRKTFDFFLALSSLSFILISGNHFIDSNPVNNFNQAQASFKPSAHITEKPAGGKKKNTKKFIKHLIKKYKQASDGEKVALIILTIIIALAAVYLLAVLSCSIACSGLEALAYVVFLLGLGGIIFGVAKIIGNINRKSKKKEAEINHPG